MPGRPALRDVVHVGDDLELGDRLAAHLRLAEPGAGDALRDLLAVEVELELIVADARRVAMLLAVIPLTISDSSCQFRPCSGSSAIWRRSMLPPPAPDDTSTSGACEVTVTVSSTPATFIVDARHGGVLADEQLDVGDLGGREP